MMKTVYVKRILAIIAILILSFSLFAIGCGSDTPEYPILKWRTDGLYGILPPPTVEYGKIVSDSESTLEFTMYGVDKKAFSTYVQLCSEKGFTHNVVNTNEFFYSVTNEQGYKISMQYVKTSKELNVTLDATGVIIKVGRPSEDFRGLMYTDVADMMKALGFINVQTQEVSVSASSEHADYSVESVTVGGNYFGAEDSLVCSLPVVIRYYKRSIEIRFSAEELTGKDRFEVDGILRRAGFTNITLQENLAAPDTTLPDSMDNKTVSVSINGQTAFKVGDQFPPAAFITLNYHCLDMIMDTSSDSLKGQRKDSVRSKLAAMGFRDIRLVPTHEGGERIPYTKDDTVASVKIGTAEAFDPNARFKRSDTVFITYYELDISIPKSAKTLKNYASYGELVEYLRSLGFVNITVQASHELINGWINKPDEVKSVTVNGNGKFDENTVFHHDHEIIIIYYAY